jgi:hypothetical protein
VWIDGRLALSSTSVSGILLLHDAQYSAQTCSVKVLESASMSTVDSPSLAGIQEDGKDNRFVDFDVGSYLDSSPLPHSD